jgi:predicted exporter
MMKTMHRPLLLLPIFVAACGLFALGFSRLHIDTDVVNAMPTSDPVIRETAAIFKAHPIQDQVFIDLSLAEVDPDRLVQCAAAAEQMLEDSDLFSSVGAAGWQDAIPELVLRIAANLPILFTAAQLDQQVAPRLSAEAMDRRAAETVRALASLSGIGRASLLEADPLGLSEIVLARLEGAAPTSNARIYKGRVLSLDGAHLLVPAKPARSATDTDFARKVAAQIETLSTRLNERLGEPGLPVKVTSVGAFRSALDNERMIRHDVEAALLFSAAGILLLLLSAFSRPLLGLAAMIPAAVGAMTALFVYSLFSDAISAMVLGFGGAVVSITVDHGIAYLLFVDSSVQSDGRTASTEVRAVGLLAALTSIGAFAALTLTAFPAFRQLGLFAALGIAVSFLFVHTVFPFVIPAMPPARTRRRLLSRAADGLSRLGKPGAVAALTAAVVLAAVARPGFDVSLSSMNTVSAETKAAEALFSRVWGGIFDRIFVMTEAEDLDELRRKMDALYLKVQPDLSAGVLETGFTASAIFPGPMLARQNRAAWEAFFTPEKVSEVQHRLGAIFAGHGFSPDAFKPFFQQLSAEHGPTGPMPISKAFFDLAGISRTRQGDKWIQVSTLTTGPAYDGARFRDRYREIGKIFDPTFFSERLGRLLFSSFSALLMIIGASVVLLLLLFFLDVKMTAVSLLPVGFAMICTLGTLTLLGRPLDIPGLMLSIVVVGMGIDYSLFFVRSFQRYGSMEDPAFSRIRLAVFMAGASTLIGFGVLCFSQHTLLRSAGITSFLGIGYAMLGAFLILPPVLGRLQKVRRLPPPSGTGIKERVLWRYRPLEAYPRMFARFKLRFDPMFVELPDLLPDPEGIETILDVGTGYGVPGIWLLERHPQARLWGIEPDGNRVRVAARAAADRAKITVGCAPALPAPPVSADLAVMFDMLHYLNDRDLKKTLEGIHEKLSSGGILMVRVAVPPKRRWALLWHLEKLRLRLRKLPGHYRSTEQIGKIIGTCGFRIDDRRSSGTPPGELAWFKAIKAAGGRQEEP